MVAAIKEHAGKKTRAVVSIFLQAGWYGKDWLQENMPRCCV